MIFSSFLPPPKISLKIKKRPGFEKTTALKTKKPWAARPAHDPFHLLLRSGAQADLPKKAKKAKKAEISACAVFMHLDIPVGIFFMFKVICRFCQGDFFRDINLVK
jgi:hypothetical protein